MNGCLDDLRSLPQWLDEPLAMVVSHIFLTIDARNGQPMEWANGGRYPRFALSHAKLVGLGGYAVLG